MQTDHTGTADFRCVGISSFAVDECVGWLVQVSLTLFAVTGSARLAEGVNAKSMRLTCTSQPTHPRTHPRNSNAAEIRCGGLYGACTCMQGACTCMLHACYTHVRRMLHACYTHVTRMLHACNTHATCMQHACLGTCWSTHVSCMLHACNMHVTCGKSVPIPCVYMHVT